MKRSHGRIPKAALAAIFAIAAFAACTTLADPNGTPTGGGGETLTDFVKRGDLNGIKKFYSNQEQLNKRDPQEGLYPLHYAVKAIQKDNLQKDNSQIVEILIVLGAKVDVQDPAGKTPLRYAVDRGLVETVKMLVDRGANPFLADASGATSAEAALMAGGDMIPSVFSTRNINASGIDGRTALHIAADRLLLNVMPKLLELKPDVQVRDKAGRTPLDLVLQYPDRIEAPYIAESLIINKAIQILPEFDWFAISARARDYNTKKFQNDNYAIHEAVIRQQRGFIKFLLEKKVELNVRNRAGNTPLHETIKRAWLEGAELLFTGNQDPNWTNADNQTPLHMVIPESIRLGCINLLLDKNADATLKDNDGNTALHIAVQNKYSTQILEKLIAARSDVNAANSAGDTPLIIAVRLNYLEHAKFLVDKKADLFALNAKQESALSLAVASGLEAVKSIVSESSILQKDSLGNGVLATAVMLEGSREVVSYLISMGGDPNQRNNMNETALHVAVRRNLGTLGTLLLEAKADIFSTSTKGESPLILGLEHKDGPLEWLFTPANLAARDITYGDSPLHYAARRNLGPGILYLAGKEPKLLAAVNKAHETPLHTAVRVDGATSVRVLLSLGANMSARDLLGNSPLYTAVQSDADECMKVLVLAGADINIRNFNSETVLHQAVRKRNVTVLRYLLDHGATTDPRDSSGQTPLSLAATFSAGELAKALLGAKSEVDARDLSGKTPLYIAVESGNLELTRIFVSAGADIFARSGVGESPLSESFRKGAVLLRELLPPSGANRTDSDGRTAIRLIVDNGASLEYLETALSAGVRIDVRDRNSETALHVAIRRRDYDFALAARLVQAGADLFSVNLENASPASLAIGMGPEAIKIIVAAAGKVAEAPAGIMVKDMLGNGLLHYAALAENAEAVKALLELGADPSRVNAAGDSPAQIAINRNNPTLAAILAVKPAVTK